MLPTRYGIYMLLVPGTSTYSEVCLFLQCVTEINKICKTENHLFITVGGRSSVVERLLRMLNVGGSIPLASKIKSRFFILMTFSSLCRNEVRSNKGLINYLPVIASIILLPCSRKHKFAFSHLAIITTGFFTVASFPTYTCREY